ncbi:hypothetical protein CG436_20985 [Pantoea ananatis]|nr:hypothetical protein CG436_20985 [Pantoea ananatis]
MLNFVTFLHYKKNPVAGVFFQVSHCIAVQEVWNRFERGLSLKNAKVRDSTGIGNCRAILALLITALLVHFNRYSWRRAQENYNRQWYCVSVETPFCGKAGLNAK